MNEVTQILRQIESGDSLPAKDLLPLIYDELRKLAAQRLAHEKPGQTLQPTALVHEAYLRLVDVKQTQHWQSRGHFFAAAAEAMRRILIENARHKKSLRKGGGQLKRVDLLADDAAVDESASSDLLMLDDALSKLAESRGDAAQLVQLRVFAGLSVQEAAGIMGVSERTARRTWTYAQAWLRREMHEESANHGEGAED